MATGYFLQDWPNKLLQYGWPRKRVSGVVGVHTAENNTDFGGPDPGAEDVAGYLLRRDSHGSYHALADADSRIKLVHPSYAAWADTTNNAHALSVSGALQAARWRELTPDRAAAVTRQMAYAAAELVQDALAAGLLDAPVPARRITAAEAVAGSRPGFYGHGETNPATRYDPGQHFNWELFLATYASAVGGGLNYQGSTPEKEDEVSAQEVLSWPLELTNGQKSTVAVELAKIGPDQQATQKALRDLNATLAELPTKIAEALYTHPVRLVTGQPTDLLTELATLRPDLWSVLKAVGAVQVNGAQVDTEAVATQIREKLAKQLGGETK